MSTFIDKCRREWRRLGVPDQVADEMATELTADLQEAEAEGISHEKLLGESASDPRAFAASWATERGVARTRLRDKLARPFVAAGVLLVVVAAVVLAVHVSIRDRPRTPAQAAIQTPGLLGLPTKVVTAAAENVGRTTRLHVVTRVGTLRVVSRAGARGTILKQTPPPGTGIAAGSTTLLVQAQMQSKR